MTFWLIDTGPIVAYFDKSDLFHPWAVDQFKKAPVPFVTCEAVIVEAVHLLNRHGGKGDWVLELIERNVLVISYQLAKDVRSVRRLFTRYSDQKIDLADACLIQMTEEFKDCKLLTVDSDFKIYRRYNKQPIPIICPE